MWSETIEVFLNIIETSLILTGLLFTAFQLNHAARSITQASEHNKEANEWNRKIAAQNALDRLAASPILSKLQARFNYIDEKAIIPVQEIEKACNDDNDLKNELFDLLNSYEKIARGVNLGMYDDEVIRVGRRGAISKAYFSFGELILHRRQHYGAPNAWKELEVLVQRWETSDPTWLLAELKKPPFC